MHPAVGHTQTLHDRMDPARAQALAIALGLAPPTEALPPFFHQAYFWQPELADALGRDGHPAVGGFIPDLGLPRRMWAGGAVTFHTPLRLGEPARKTIEITAVDRKTGRSGPLGFVTLRHRIFQADALCVEERQDLVYRPDETPPSAPPQSPNDIGPEPLAADPVLLFRYSALTLNGHRIHYDADYARQVEGYAAPVVHGPLLAQWMMLRAARERPLAHFAFRGRSPLTLGTPATLCQSGAKLWVRSAAGALIMEGEAQWS